VVDTDVRATTVVCCRLITGDPDENQRCKLEVVTRHGGLVGQTQSG
jgi:hypothetical protein